MYPLLFFLPFFFNASMNRHFSAKQKKFVSLNNRETFEVTYNIYKCLLLMGSQDGRIKANVIAKDRTKANSLEPAEISEKGSSICLP